MNASENLTNKEKLNKNILEKKDEHKQSGILSFKKEIGKKGTKTKHYVEGLESEKKKKNGYIGR